MSKGNVAQNEAWSGFRSRSAAGYLAPLGWVSLVVSRRGMGQMGRIGPIVAELLFVLVVSRFLFACRFELSLPSCRSSPVLHRSAASHASRRAAQDRSRRRGRRLAAGSPAGAAVARRRCVGCLRRSFGGAGRGAVASGGRPPDHCPVGAHVRSRTVGRADQRAGRPAGDGAVAGRRGSGAGCRCPAGGGCPDRPAALADRRLFAGAGLHRQSVCRSRARGARPRRLWRERRCRGDDAGT